MTPKPQAKANLIHQQILAGLIQARPATRTHKVWDPSLKDGKGDVVETKVSTGAALVNPLAQNVSESNVDRVAQRWSR